MIKKLLIFFVVSCLAIGNAEAKTKPIMNSLGNPDIAKYKTFTIMNTFLPNTPEFLRNLPIFQNLVYRFQQEGFKFVDNLKEADFAATISFIDAVGQEYVPPRTFTYMNYDPGTTTTRTTGLASGFGNFVNFQASSHSASTASATASTITTGGYFVPNYGVALAINIYNTKTQQLIWSGAGASKANVSNIYAAVDNIILSIIDGHLITPAYLKGERKKIRKAYEKREDICFKPIAPPEKIGFFKPTYKDESDGMGIICNLKTRGQLLETFISLKNNTDENVIFSPERLRMIFQNKELYILTKSDLAGAYFKAGKAAISEASYLEDKGFIGALFSPLEELFGTSRGAREKKTRKAVEFIYENYMDNYTIEPGKTYAFFADAVMPFALLSDGSEVTIIIPLRDESIDVEFEYLKDWITAEQYNKAAKKYK